MQVTRGKAAPALPGSPAEDVSDLDQRARDRLEDTIAAALTALAARWIERAIARLESPKQRKGTRHWQASGPDDRRIGTKALDAARVVDEETWASEAESGTEPIITAAAVAAAAAQYADLGDADTTTDHVGRLVASTIRSVVSLISASAARQAAAASGSPDGPKGSPRTPPPPPPTAPAPTPPTILPPRPPTSSGPNGSAAETTGSGTPTTRPTGRHSPSGSRSSSEARCSAIPVTRSPHSTRRRAAAAGCGTARNVAGVRLLAQARLEARCQPGRWPQSRHLYAVN
jgi:hypothetical protein